MKYYLTEQGRELLNEADTRHLTGGERDALSREPLTRFRRGESGVGINRGVRIRRAVQDVERTEQARIARQKALASGEGAESGIETRRMRRRGLPSVGNPEARQAQHAAAQAGAAKSVRRAAARAVGDAPKAR